jgi:predicted enzyme related to lactoylglutathione lyase
VDVPVDEIRELLGMDDASVQLVLEKHRQRLADRMRALINMTATLDEYLEKGSPMPAPTGSRPVQMTIHADDVPTAIAFYSQVFGAEYIAEISSFQFGAWNTDSFYLLTIEPQPSDGSNYPGRNACLGFYVDDLDSVHQRALDAGGTEVHPPKEFEWKPRTSLVNDPSGNRLALTQR